MSEPDGAGRYRLSFSVGGLFVQEAPIATDLYLHRTRNWTQVREALDADNLLQARTASSARRMGRELVQRMAELDNNELEWLMEGRSTEWAYLMWVAACRRYALIGEFAEEVVRERFLLMTPSLEPERFEDFVRSKALWHDELDDLSESTLRKLRTTVYLMLREAGLLSEAGQIMPALLSEPLTRILRRRQPSQVRFFPTLIPLTGDDDD
ncbi:DUF1819 family protein [Streptomyces sp. So13.3]|uniref:DUF1819 family protein n=1 Tax=Streptomyces sp. So13.3 TaxID=2136173 RepID=UPI0011066202|nr:DUF1819 family protein [Streptomyces sp. So13.3]QNA72480.1 DUF1819 family protein [Streptomyces sp. So13.3]